MSGRIEPGDIAGAVQTLADAFWRGEPSAGTLTVYFSVLDDLTTDELETAVARAIRECDFMPSPGKLLELAGRDRKTGRAEEIPEYHRPMPDFLPTDHAKKNPHGK